MCIVLLCSLLLAGYLNTNSSKDLNAHSNRVNYQTPAVDGSAVDNTKLYSYQPIQPTDLSMNPSATASKNLVPAITIVAAPKNTPTGLSAHSSPYKIAAPTTLAAKSLTRLKFNDQQKNNSGLLSSSSTATNTNSKNVVERNVAPDGIATVTPVEEMSKNTPVEIPGSVDAITTIGKSKNITELTNSMGSNTEELENYVSAFTVAETTDGRLQATPIAVSNLSNDAKNGINTVSQPSENTPAVASSTTTILSETDKAWIENFAQYNKPAPKKWKGKTSWQAYITPSLVYRKLHNNTADKEISGNGNGNFNSADIDAVVVQKPSFGIETGFSLQYQLLKVVKIKAGIQLNYTRYNAHAFENHHPISTSLTMNTNNGGAYEVFRTTAYSNTYGLNPVKLHNETYQVSIPFGADLRLFSSNKISWYAGAALQPTWIVFGNSYLVSSDRRNYIKDNSMLNRFNMNAAFETYVSFKTDTYTWQIGPQYRSQLFSTNNKTYSVEERLVNFGLKIGVTKKL
jgi:hypothetical protein